MRLWSLAKHSACMPRQLKVLSEASQPKREVLYQVKKTGTHLLVFS